MGKNKNKSGFTLVEVLISALIIAILVIGGSAALYQTGSSVVIAGKKRVALAIANQRLELAKYNYYYLIAPDEYDVSGTYYLAADNINPAQLAVTDSEVVESITIGDLAYEMTTEVLRHSRVGGTVNFDPEALQVTVRVVYRSATDEAVELTTLLLPPEVTNGSNS